MQPLSSLSKNLQHFLIVSAVWLVACTLYVWASAGSIRLLSATDVFTILFGQCIIIAGIHYSEMRRVNREHLAKFMENVDPTRTAIFAYLTQIPNFLLDQWCVLPAPTGLRAIAVDADKTQLIILDSPTNTRHSSVSAPGPMTFKMWKQGDVMTTSLEETNARDSWSAGQIFNDHHRAYRIASKLLGTVGLPMSHAPMVTKKTYEPDTPPLASPMPIDSHPINKLWLQVTLGAEDKTVEELIFLEGESNTADPNYLFALENARYWQAVLENLGQG